MRGGEKEKVTRSKKKKRESGGIGQLRVRMMRRKVSTSPSVAAAPLFSPWPPERAAASLGLLLPL